MKELNLVLKELKRSSKIDEQSVKLLVSSISKANKIFVEGAGRSGYVSNSFVMRLKHLGLKITSKPCDNDLMIVISGSGKTRLILNKVKKLSDKTDIFCITMDKTSPIAKLSHGVLVIKAKQSRQPLRSLFEQECLLFLDAVILILMKKLKVTEKQMWGRHK
jgi:6-phospho-3-hexuloisomerase